MSQWTRVTIAVLLAILYICGCVAKGPKTEIELSPPELAPISGTPAQVSPALTPEPYQEADASQTPEKATSKPENTPLSYRDTPGDLPQNPQKKEYDRVKKINSDVVGWIHVPNTRIDYPVVRTDNNDYYLERTVEKKSLKAGSIFMDYRNVDPQQQRHVILYGHNMKSGSMFKTLSYYKNNDFLKNNKIITYYWDDKPVQYEVYASFIATEDVDFLRTKFQTPKEFETYMSGLQERSKYKSDVKITEDDQVLTLMTCSYELSDARFVVQAKRVQG